MLSYSYDILWSGRHSDVFFCHIYEIDHVIAKFTRENVSELSGTCCSIGDYILKGSCLNFPIVRGISTAQLHLLLSKYSANVVVH